MDVSKKIYILWSVSRLLIRIVTEFRLCYGNGVQRLHGSALDCGIGLFVRPYSLLGLTANKKRDLRCVISTDQTVWWSKLI